MNTKSISDWKSNLANTYSYFSCRGMPDHFTFHVIIPLFIERFSLIFAVSNHTTTHIIFNIIHVFVFNWMNHVRWWLPSVLSVPLVVIRENKPCDQRHNYRTPLNISKCDSSSQMLVLYFLCFVRCASVRREMRYILRCRSSKSLFQAGMKIIVVAPKLKIPN